MGIAAREKQNEILLGLPENKRLFPINAGMGWQGKTVRHDSGVIVLANPRPLHAAPTGWFDLCGWEEVEVTQEMVGTKVAIFCGEEIKIGKDRESKEQKGFKKILQSMGGRYKLITE